ncbi:MAG TPA: hypothetical protein VH459_03240 [Gaiellales bacterium]|jgi:hypothetical protein
MSNDDHGRDADDDGATFVVLRGADDLLETDAADAFVAFIPVDNPRAAELLTDPIALFKKVPALAGFEIDEKWHVTVNRVNAEEPVHNPGPHHLLTHGLVLKDKKQVHCTVHRSVLDPKTKP